MMTELLDVFFESRACTSPSILLLLHSNCLAAPSFGLVVAAVYGTMSFTAPYFANPNTCSSVDLTHGHASFNSISPLTVLESQLGIGEVSIIP